MEPDSIARGKEKARRRICCASGFGSRLKPSAKKNWRLRWVLDGGRGWSGRGVCGPDGACVKYTRTALISQMRGLLLDRGIAIAVSATPARRLIPKILAAANDELTKMMREIVSSLYAFMLQIDERIKAFDRKIRAIFKASAAKSRKPNPSCHRRTVHDVECCVRDPVPPTHFGRLGAALVLTQHRDNFAPR